MPGRVRYIAIHGVLFAGMPFAALMFAAGYYFSGSKLYTFGEYLSLTSTWITFIVTALVFGLIFGIVKRHDTQREK